MLNEQEIVGLSNPTANKKIKGVYFLVNNNTVVYVGIANDVYARLRAHKHGRFIFNKWYYIAIDDKDLRCKVEIQYIQKLKPIYNFQDHPDREMFYKRVVYTFLHKWNSAKEVADLCRGVVPQNVNDVVLRRKKEFDSSKRDLIIRTIMSRCEKQENLSEQHRKKAIREPDSRTL